MSATSEIQWHEYPQDRPEKNGVYLCTENSSDNSDGLSCCAVDYYRAIALDRDCWDMLNGNYPKDIAPCDILAWAELPKPYGC